MNREQTQAVAQVVAGAVLAVVVAAASLWGLSRLSGGGPVEDTSFGAQALAGDVTNFGGLEADINSSTAEGLDVDQTGSGDIVVFRDGGSAVWTLADGGTIAYGGNLDLAGNTVIWDVDDDTTAVASSDDIITYTLGAATGRLDLLTGNLKVGNGTEDTTLNGEDAYIEGTLEVDGAANFDGSVDIDGALTSATGSITVSDSLNATGAVDFDSTLNVDSTIDGIADIDVGTFLNLSAQSTISVTAGAIITPTGSYQPLTSAAAGAACDTSTCISSGGETGDLLILHNINSTGVITLDGTGGTVECKADVNLDAGDTISFVWNGSAWNCVANYDNS